MRERLLGLIPEYFRSKLTDDVDKELRMMPRHLRKAIIHGTPREAAEAYDDLAALERQRGEFLLGPAAREQLADMRETVQQGKMQD